MAFTQPGSNNRLNFSINLKFIILLLLAVIAAMLLTWKPWDDTAKSVRTIQVTGQATLKSTPDEFVFYPTYEFNNDNKTAALAELTKKNTEIVTKLKELGVPDAKIKTNAADYGSKPYLMPVKPESSSYNLSLMITVSSKDLAQKVQDYLLTTLPSGAVTPQPAFSNDKRKKLETQARAKAERDARIKAEQSATNLGFELGKVKSISEGSGFGDIIPLMGSRAADSVEGSALPIQGGENELNYSVSVTYFIK